MKLEPLPQFVFRAHGNDRDALSSSTKSGTYRWDDFRPDGERRFDVLYTGDSVEGCLIEVLQRFRGSDEEAFAILAAIDDAPKDTVPAPRQNRVLVKSGIRARRVPANAIS